MHIYSYYLRSYPVHPVSENKGCDTQRRTKILVDIIGQYALRPEVYIIAHIYDAWTSQLTDWIGQRGKINKNLKRFFFRVSQFFFKLFMYQNKIKGEMRQLYFFSSEGQCFYQSKYWYIFLWGIIYWLIYLSQIIKGVAWRLVITNKMKKRIKFILSFFLIKGV